jgi:hypothetical protein
MGPLVLLRDLYFSNPTQFKRMLENKQLFRQEAEIVLQDQLLLMRERINRATSRSITYVFLTKMVFGILIEVPFDRMTRGHLDWLSLTAMVLVPVLVMWFLVSTIKLPGVSEQEALIDRAEQIVFDYEALSLGSLVLNSLDAGMSIIQFAVFYVVYGALFFVMFAAIIAGLAYLKFTVASILIFVFFLCVIMFFAYRIRQTAQIYTYNSKESRRSSLLETFALPMVAVGGVVSREVSRLNFLVFIMDFVLEAPFKIILQFLDNWTRFLTLKKDEVIG